MRLSAATQAGVAAYERRDEKTALEEFTLAVRLARSQGMLGHLERLRGVVMIDEFGGVRLRQDITIAALRVLDIGSTRHRDPRGPSAVEQLASQPAVSSPAQPPPVSARSDPEPWEAEPALVSRTCPRGHVTVGQDVKYCEELGCRHEFSDDDD